MAAAKPYLTSNDLVATVQRKISLPLTQNTFSFNDVLAFCNDEMFSSAVPRVMQVHEEYFVYSIFVPVNPGQNRYPIPDRSIGMKLRDVKWQDSNRNLFDMSRVNPEDKAYYQQNIGTSETISKYYIEGNDLVLLPALTLTNSINLRFDFFLRPNQLVANERAATITSFANRIVTLNANIAADDTVTLGLSAAPITLTAVTAITDVNQFLIGTDDIQTASNLVTAINTTGIATASNGSPASATIILNFATYDLSQTLETSNPEGFVLPDNQVLLQFDQVPATYQDTTTFVTDQLFVNGVQIDFLQTKPGHRTYNYDVTIPANGISGNVVAFNADDVPQNMIIGDYMALANECIIPQIPPDLHNWLAQQAATMILGSMGDTVGLQVAQQKNQEMILNQNTLLDARVEGSPLKVVNRRSLLRYQSYGSRRRRY